MFRAFIIGVACISFSQVSAAQDVDAILEQIRNGDFTVMQNDREIVCGIGMPSIARAEIALKKRAKTLNEKIAENAKIIANTRADLDEAVNRPVHQTRRALVEALRDDPKALNKYVSIHGCHSPCRDEKVRLSRDFSSFQDQLTLIQGYMNKMETEAPGENFEQQVAGLRDVIKDLNSMADRFDQRVQSIHARDLEILRLRAELTSALGEDQRKAIGY